MDQALFSYTVDPSTIDYSGGPNQLSVVDLTITATNPGTTDVACTSIAFTPTVGDGQTGLTTDPSTIAVAPGATTPWAIGGGSGTFTAVPLPPVTSIPAGGSVSFVLADVVVNDSGGPAEIDVVETTDAQRGATLSVTKSAVVPAGSTPSIQAFTAAPAVVAQGGTSTLTWATTDAERSVLGPGAVDLPNPGGGQVPIAVDATTTYTLDAIGAGGRVSAVVTVTVGSVAIGSFTAAPATPVAPGTSVTLTWETQYASSCSIDQGVGPVPTSGSVVVTPQQTTVYTVSALGRHPLSSSVTVHVTS
ncbi:hypothetical protein [Nocardioides caricicola]|uniref:DUF11 domain-containing protein n=1 Tax=Nocardioides caricicola TaxID=634770 RepID=A0ABW0N278_9ACTN